MNNKALNESSYLDDLINKLAAQLRADGYHLYFSDIMDSPTQANMYLTKGYYCVGILVSNPLLSHSFAYVKEKVNILKKHLDEIIAENSDLKW